jgi:uncharacterized protein (TIGR02246 family)
MAGRARLAALALPLAAVLPFGCATPRDADAAGSVAPAAAPADADTRAVLATVQALFDAMATRDVVAAARTLLPDGLFVSVGAGAPRSTTTRAFLESLAAGDSKLCEAFTAPPDVRLDGDLATVWGPYTFTVDGKLSHTGVDALQLVRTNEGWRLTGGIYSVVRPAAPPPAPSATSR